VAFPSWHFLAIQYAIDDLQVFQHGHLLSGSALKHLIGDWRAVLLHGMLRPFSDSFVFFIQASCGRWGSLNESGRLLALVVVQATESERRDKVLERVDVVEEHIVEIIAHHASIARVFS